MKPLIINFILIALTSQVVFCQNSSMLTKKIDDYIKPYLEMQAWSGVVSIYEAGQPIIQKAYGKADRELGVENTVETRFRIASLSKIFTETAILKLAEESKLKMETSLSKFIPDYPRGDEIKIKHLLNHSSGIPHLNEFENYDTLTKFTHTLPEITEYFKYKPLDFDPGSDINYSNSGYVLLAFIIEKASGISFEDYLEKKILQPYGLQNTGVDNHSKIIKNRAKGYTFNESAKPINADFVDMSIKKGGGSLYSTILDLNHFIYLLTNGEIVGDFLNQTSLIEKNKNEEEVIILDGRVSGFCHRMVYYLKENYCVTVLGNNYGKIANSISDDIQKIVNNEPYQIPKNYLSISISLDDSQLKAYEGIYDFGFGPKRIIKLIDGSLTYRSGENGSSDKLIPIDNDTFFYLRYWTLVRFRKEDAKTFNKIDWIMGDSIWSGEKVKNN